ncbi:ParM/StbA family protein [Noviherbaspirillum galbum]|uniref:ParM/StbA family protein n=1 Tax=Noviherbaspirillum galbum TaxID=2709383 RepID=A0A6B3SH06_9BURK|nr:ParM/StbA family protein [Noviherbaspirillum galbum]NEX60134.1 ParM/StbA family protein [Noviherbaspirillum galbum]
MRKIIERSPSMETSVSVGLDIGHSAPKSVWANSLHPGEHHTDSFPTFVIKAFELGQDTPSTSAMTVEIDGEKYFIGETARRQGRMERFTGLDEDWIHSAKHDALVVGAFQRVLANIATRQPTPPSHFEVVVGLPSGLFMAQRDALRERVTARLSKLLKDGQTIAVRPQDQAFGPLQEIMFTQDGKINPSRDLENESWGAIEVGQFSTDFSLFEQGERIESAAGSCSGMYTVYERLAPQLKKAKLPNDFLALDMAVRTGEIKIFNDVTDVREMVANSVAPLIDEIIETATVRFGTRRNYLTGLVIAGGGAPLMLDRLKEFIPCARMPELPRFSVAEGFCRLGLHAASIAKQ